MPLPYHQPEAITRGEVKRTAQGHRQVRLYRYRGLHASARLPRVGYEQVLADHRRLLREALSSHRGSRSTPKETPCSSPFTRLETRRGGSGRQRALIRHDSETRSNCGSARGSTPVSRPGPPGATSDRRPLGSAHLRAWGGQVVVSSARGPGSGEAEWTSLRSLGDHALKTIEARVELHRVVGSPAVGVTPSHQPARSWTHASGLSSIRSPPQATQRDSTRLIVALLDPRCRRKSAREGG